MNIEQMLQQTDAVGAISRELGIDPQPLRRAQRRCCPRSSRVSSNRRPRPSRLTSPAGAQSSAFGSMGGLGGLLGTIGGLGGGALLDNAVSKRTDRNRQGQ